MLLRARSSPMPRARSTWLGSTLADVYERIAAELRAQYTLGYYPAGGVGSGGWRALRVAVAVPGNATVRHRPAYYVPATR